MALRKPFRGFGFDQAEQQALAKAGITDEAALWAAAARDPGQALVALGDATGLDPERLAVPLATGASREVKPARGSPLARHWLDLLLLAGLALLAWLAFVREPPGTAKASYLRASEPVAAFQVLTRTQLGDTLARPPKDAVTTLAAAEGRVVLRALKRGDAITAADLGPSVPRAALAGRSVLSLTTPAARTPVVPRAGDRVTLLLSSRAPGAVSGAVLRDALVLSAAPKDSVVSLVVALPRGDLPTVAALLGSSEVHVVSAPP